jgi:ankyrin repeat protein
MENEANKQNHLGQSPLHVACTSGRESLVKLLLEKNVDVNLKDSTGCTPLHLACRLGYAHIVRQFTNVIHSSRSIVNARNNSGLTPLHLACGAGHHEMVSWLLNHGADRELYASQSPDNNTAVQEQTKTNHLVEAYSRMPEQERRWLLQEAVKQGHWNVVLKWADHTLYDDQRWWAIKEAQKQKQWDVMLLLADHGLTENERTCVHHQIAKNARWSVVLQMLERGIDIPEIRKIVENALGVSKKRKKLLSRLQRIINLEKIVELRGKQYWINANCQRDWRLAMFYLFKYRSTRVHRGDIFEALKICIRKKAWHIVMQLVKLNISSSLRDNLFTAMADRGQWGVCRVLLEQGVSVQLCEGQLPTFVEHNQWTLVSRVMEYNVDDETRRKVIKWAMDKGEGSVVWRCMSTMHEQPSVVERNKFFEEAFSRGMWQALKPLVEFADETGIQHRTTAFLAGIEKHQWDVVDHCHIHGADLGMADEFGDSPLNRAARSADWDAVEALAIRGADINRRDRYDSTLLHRAIEAKQWDAVKFAMECLGNLHAAAYCDQLAKMCTPLQMLISEQGDLIEHSLILEPSAGHCC